MAIRRAAVRTLAGGLRPPDPLAIPEQEQAGRCSVETRWDLHRNFARGITRDLWRKIITVILWFVAINGTLHFGVDFVTSRITSRLYAQERWHDFFAVVGFDQLIHQVTLAAMVVWLLGVSGPSTA